MSDNSFLYTTQVSYEEGRLYAEEIKATFFETSAKEGTNVQQLFDSIGNAAYTPHLIWGSCTVAAKFS